MENYTPERPLRLIELFAGIGSQTQALTNIGVPHRVVAISEIDKYAVKSYEAMHGPVVNLGDIREIQSLPEADLWTYSFPCQDISVAGKLGGIEVGTRSGLLYEVERLLQAAAEAGTLPKYLLLENVKNLVGKRFRADFDEWLVFLASLGYSNYWKVLNAKDYGIPQNRERVFCVSIRGKHTPFVFPDKQELTLRLRDMLESEVDERYYLKEATIQAIIHSSFNQRRTMLRNPDDMANTLLSRDYKDPQCVQVGELVGDKWEKMNDISRRVYDTDGLSPTVHCQQGGNTELKIAAMRGRNPENPSDRTTGQPTEQRLEINEHGVSNTLTSVQKDNLVIEQGFVARKYKKFIEENGYLPEFFNAYNGTEIKEVSKTITCSCCEPSQSGAILKLDSEYAHAVRCSGHGSVDRHAWDTLMVENKLLIRNATKKGYDEAEIGDYVNTSFPNSKTKRGRVGKGVAQALTCGNSNAVVTKKVRIRKLTPRECLRLMGWNDEQIDKIQAANISGTQQYKQAGNGIVVQVLEAIFQALFLS